MTINALEELSKVKNGDEIWSSLGSLTFVKSDIKDTENVLVGAGGGVVITATRENAIKILKGRLKELGDKDAEIVNEINKAGGLMEKAEKDIHAFAEKKS